MSAPRPTVWAESHSVLDARRRNNHGPEQPESINDNGPLPAGNVFSRIVAAWSALLRRLDILAVEAGCRGFRRLTRLSSYPLAQFDVQVFPRAVLLPEPEVIEHDPIRQQVVRLRTPCAAVAGHAENRVENLAPRIVEWPAAGLGFGAPGAQSAPIGRRLSWRGRESVPCGKPHAISAVAKREPLSRILRV